VRVEQRRYDDPVVALLVEQLQQEYVVRYGSRDETEVDADEFAPPGGTFLLGSVAGEVVAMGGWRSHEGGDHVVEIKRMYVLASARRRGYARLMLTELERTATEAGARAIVLNTGQEQPEAVALYESTGYAPVPGYGIYLDAPLALFYGKDLARQPA